MFYNGYLCWSLSKHHTDGGKRFRDHIGHFATPDAVREAIAHLELAPARIPAFIPAKAEP